MAASCIRKQHGERLTYVVVGMGEVEIQGLDLSGFILVTQKAAGAAAVPRMNFHLILSSSLLSEDQDILPDPRNIKNFSFIHASLRWTQSVCPLLYNCETEAETTAEELGWKWSEVLRDVGAPSPTRTGKPREKGMSLQLPFPPFFFQPSSLLEVCRWHQHLQMFQNAGSKLVQNKTPQ